jgi:chromosomal replication initiation ATPase DnaA
MSYPACPPLPLADACAIFEQVSKASGLSVDALTSESRALPVVTARRAVIRLMRGRKASHVTIGRRMQLDYTTVMHALKRFEQDDAAQAIVAKVRAG